MMMMIVNNYCLKVCVGQVLGVEKSVQNCANRKLWPGKIREKTMKSGLHFYWKTVCKNFLKVI